MSRHITNPERSLIGNNKDGDNPLFRYPTDFLRDVVPIPCHSHNDYWRSEPLFSAVRAGCIGVEADVWLFDNNDRGVQKQPRPLLVGHDPAALTESRTFASLYVDPIVELLDRMNHPPQTPFYHADASASAGHRSRGIFDFDPEQTLVLLVDVKTDGAATWPVVLEQLEPLRARGWLTYFEGEAGEVHTGPVTVVGTGNTLFDLLARNSTYRDAFFDAPLESLWEEEGDGGSTGQEEDHHNSKYDRTNSFYASTSFKEAIGPVVPLSHHNGGLDLSEDQLRTIRGQIRGAHRRGLKARYWETPSWPISVRNWIWHILVEEEGADILNVDDLSAASRSVW